MLDNQNKNSSKDLINYYDKEYFLTCNRGYETFNKTKGMVLPYVLRYPFELADIKEGERGER